jgi:hypothetical protein
MISHLLYSIWYHIWWVNKLMQPALGRPGLHSGLGSFFNTNSSLSTAGSILRRNQCLSMTGRSASKYGAMQPGHWAVPVWRSLRCSPCVEFGSKRFTNRVQTHRRRLHQRASASVASFWSAAAGPHRPLVAKRCLRAGLSCRGSRQAGPPCMLRGVWIASEPPWVQRQI